MHLVHASSCSSSVAIWARITAWTSRCTSIVLVPRSILTSEYSRQVPDQHGEDGPLLQP